MLEQETQLKWSIKGEVCLWSDWLNSRKTTDWLRGPLGKPHWKQMAVKEICSFLFIQLQHYLFVMVRLLPCFWMIIHYTSKMWLSLETSCHSFQTQTKTLSDVTKSQIGFHRLLKWSPICEEPARGHLSIQRRPSHKGILCVYLTSEQGQNSKNRRPYSIFLARWTMIK